MGLHLRCATLQGRSGVVTVLMTLGILLIVGCRPAPPSSESINSESTTSKSSTSPDAPSADPDPHWVIRQTPPARIALVYVHGVTGDMIDTWKAANGKTFFDLVNENEMTKGRADAFVFGFPSYLLKPGSFDIREAANKLHDRLKFHHVLDYPAIVFVAHSMGGLVVMRELLTNREVLPKVPVVVFFATPQEGAQIASIGANLSPNTAFGQLTEADGNELLQTLSDEWNSIEAYLRPHVRCATRRKKPALS